MKASRAVATRQNVVLRAEQGAPAAHSEEDPGHLEQSGRARKGLTCCRSRSLSPRRAVHALVSMQQRSTRKFVRALDWGCQASILRVNSIDTISGWLPFWPAYPAARVLETEISAWLDLRGDDGPLGLLALACSCSMSFCRCGPPRPKIGSIGDGLPGTCRG